MEFTPPGSPFVDLSSGENADLSFLSFNGLQCNGEAKRGSTFDNNSLIRSGEAMLIRKPELLATRLSSFKLFGAMYESNSASCEDLERLFFVARYRLCNLGSTPKSFGNPFSSTKSVDSFNEAGSASSRDELKDFYMMLRYCIASHSNDDSLWVLEEIAPTLKEGLALLRLELGWLVDLPSFVLEYAHGTKFSAAFELFHTHLELRWWHITIFGHLLRIESHAQLDFSQGFSQHFGGTTNSSSEAVKDAVLTTVVDLTRMAIVRFNKSSAEELVTKSAFNCTCVKELWLLLLFFIGEMQSEIENKHPFWSILDDIFDRLSSTSESVQKICRPSLKIPDKLACDNPPLFALWFLTHMAELFMYDEKGNFKSSVDNNESNHLALKRLLTQLTETSSQLSEQQRRVVVHLVRTLITDYWEAKPDAIMVLWEFFFRSLDTPFQLPGARAASFAVLSHSPRGILDSVVQLVEEKPSVKSSNSYSTFLHLLGNHLRKNPLQWKQKMRGRVFSKLSPRKVTSLSELGLFHLIQLFFVISLQTDTEDVALKLNELLLSLKDQSLEYKSRVELAFKGRLALIQLLARKGLPMGPVLQPLMAEVSNFTSRGKLETTRVFVETIEDIMKCNDSLELGQHLIIGDWVQTYLEKLTHNTAHSVLNSLMSMVKNLRSHCERDYGSLGQGPILLADAFRIHVLPYLKQQMTTGGPAPFLVADLAAYLTFLSLELPSGPTTQTESLQSLLSKFIESDSSSILLTRRYLWLTLTDEYCFENVLEHCTDKEHLPISQAWVRCCLFGANTRHEEMRDVTQRVFRLPLLAQLLRTSKENLEKLASHDDPFVSLINSVVDQLSTGKNPAHFRWGFMKIFQHLDQWVKPVKSQTSPARTKDGAAPPWSPATEIMGQPAKDSLGRLFFCVGHIVWKCSPIVFEESKADCLLVRWVQLLLLPRTLYDNETKMSVPLDEALRSTLHLFIIGLHRLGPTRVSCIKRYFKDVVTVYLPRMASMPGPLGGTAQKNPFIRLWNFDDSDAEAAGSLVLQIVSSVFITVDKKTGSPHPQFCQAIRYVRDVLRENSNKENLLRCVITYVVPCSLEVAARANVPFIGREVETLLEMVFGSVGYAERPNLWSVTENSLNQLCQQHLGFNGDFFFRMLSVLCRGYRHIVKTFLPTLRKNLDDVIKRRGVGSDRRLEALYDALANTVK